MLNQQKVARALEKSVPRFYNRYKQELLYARALWNACSTQKDLVGRITIADTQHKLAVWSGALGQTYPIEKSSQEKGYSVWAVDGSQIYPDRHYHVPCSLINIGIVGFRYASHVNALSTAYLDSKPYLSFGGLVGDYSGALTPELVDCCRTEFELQTGAWIAQKRGNDTVVLFDGTLLFWFLESKDPKVFRVFIEKYCAQLEALRKAQCLYASYISYTKSKDLIAILQKVHDMRCFSLSEALPDNTFSLLYDSDVLVSSLPEGHYSSTFMCQGPLIHYYSEYNRPCFLFYNTGDEIVRVELPAWIALDKQRVKKLMCVVADQVIKGGGYPTCLAEAHEQAVVKTSDRQLFYHMLGQYFSDSSQSSAYAAFSKKSFQKRTMGI